MTETFGQNYAGAYDAIYRSKDYAGEADLVEQILQRHGLPDLRAFWENDLRVLSQF